MPAPIVSALPEQTSFAAKSAGPSDAASPANGDGSPAAFASLFAQRIGQQAGMASDTALLATPAEPAGAQADLPTAATLEALLPFLEAMGLVKAGKEQGEAHSPEQADSPILPEVLAAPVTPQIAPAPAIPAAAQDAADARAPLRADDGRSGAMSLPGGQTNAAPSAGREFSAQLAAALEASHDGPREPGSTAAAAQQLIATHSPHHAGRAPGQTIDSPVGSPHWNEQVGQRVVWMANRQESHAELVLTPPEMGRVEVRLTLMGDQASASFVSANPQVREALEAALPRLREILAETGLPPALLELEITEAVLADDVQEAVAVLQELAALGVRLAIDDFGTGYSSMSQLRRLPFDQIKIDKSFIDGLPGDREHQAIVTATIALARSLE
ncbi:MAG: EAL domain-containing protein, partial [Rhodocyclaceae bacterium]|nr:EAL domain-containing protein [Rhodocyclaceae bacterium]